MGTGYTRNDSANNIADGNVINASDLDGEFDAVQAAFNASTGHSHDGTTGEGPKIDTAGLADDAVTGAKIDSTTTITAAGFTGPLTGTASNAALLDNIDSTSFLRSDAADTKTSGDLSFSDNVKAIFGDGSDLQVFHDATDSHVITTNGDLNLQVAGAGTINLGDQFGNTLLKVVDNADVKLYHGTTPSEKLATTATGVNILGNIVATGTTGGVAKLSLVAEEVHGEIEGINIGNNFGGLAFKTNSNGTTAERMRIDSSGNVGIGGSAVLSSSAYNAASLHLRQPGSTTTGGQLRFTTGASGHSASDGAFIAFFSDNNLFYNNQESGDHRFFNGGSETLRITSAGNIGIGTSAPSTFLDIEGANARLDINETSTGSPQIQFQVNGTEKATISAGSGGTLQLSADADQRFKVGGSERMRLDSSGNLGLGSNSPRNASGFVGITMDDTSGSFVDFNDSGTRVMTISGNATGNDINAVTAIPLRFKTNNTERLRLDASGNLLVGKTSVDYTTVGFEATPSSAFQANAMTADGKKALLLARKTSDGEILQFRKDGTTVGSIGVRNGHPSFGNNDTGIELNDFSEAVQPFNTSTNTTRDAAIDLGGSTARFKDLHLSSNVYLGGSGGTSTIFSPTSLAIDIDSNNDQTDRAFVIKTGSNNIARFTESGRLGLGTTSPSAPLHVQTTSQIVGAFIGTSSDPQIYLGDAISSDNAFIMGYDRADNRGYLTVAGDSDSAFTVINGNKVGIGSSSAIERLRVSGNVELYNDNTDGYIWFHDTGTRSWSIGSDQSTGNFAITNVQGLASGHKVQIDGSGDFLVGTNGISIGSPGNSETGLDVTQGGVAQLSATGIALYLRRTVGTGDLVRFHAGTGAGGAGSISVGTTSTSYNTSSDHRLKENITDISNAIDRVKILAPKRFNFIADADTTVDGFLAHEAQAVVPEAVTGTHNEVDEDGNAIMQGIDQSKFVPLLTAALKEAITKIEDLETRLAVLEAN